VATAIRLEKRLRGSQAGFNTPTFVVDALGGGGKRDAHSFESYDQETGISVFSAPAVKEGRLFTYFDPLSELSPHMRAAWQDDKLRHEMIHDALSKARKDII
jgi:lysine 2,3-aminomutase